MYYVRAKFLKQHVPTPFPTIYFWAKNGEVKTILTANTTEQRASLLYDLESVCDRAGISFVPATVLRQGFQQQEQQVQPCIFWYFTTSVLVLLLVLGLVFGFVRI